VTSRLFGVGVEGASLAPREREILAEHPPFGVILFRRNIESESQLERLIADVRGLGARFLFLDQEGGPVDRLRDLLAPAPSLQKAASQPGAARRAGELAGRALSRLGFDVDLAPVVDRSIPGAGGVVLGERAASADPARIIEAAGDFLDGLHSQGIGGCVKHFPGLGRARLDTHEALPVLESDPHQQALDLTPFDVLMPRARAVMISHAAGPDGIPASLSDAWATVHLRTILGFEGAAFSDDLEMGALRAFGSIPERCARASIAGCDLLFVCRRLEEYPAAVAEVAIRVPEARRVEAAERLEGYADHLAALRRSKSTKAHMEADASLAAIAAELREFVASIG
jgi:beta-N-acetylhexosaminidase